jgi:signal transduction histidine kinase
MRLRLLPASLFGRLVTALLSVVVVTAAIVAALILRERQELAFRRSDSGGVVDLVAMTSTELARMPRDARAVQLDGLRSESLSVERGPPLRPPPPQQDPQKAAALFTERLGRELGTEFGIEIVDARSDSEDVIRVTPSNPFLAAMRGAYRELDIGVVLPDGERVTYRTAVPFAEPPLPPGIFYQLLLLTAGLAVVLYAMTRTITKPLSALARAAEAVGRGERQAPLPDVGAREIRDATRAFNTMQERLHRYLDSRTQVLTAMSHDLRTPLTRLRLRAERLPDASLRERYVADLDAMSGMVIGALNVFKGLNDEEPTQAIDLAHLLGELRGEFAELDASVTIEGAAREPIAVKPQALKRCLTNLLSNAVKYGDRATVVVEEQGPELVLRILDEGPGIPEHALEEVFAPYFRLEGSRNAATGGVGLGLSIARDIAQAHGGSLVLRNRAARGLEAILRLPRGTR